MSPESQRKPVTLTDEQRAALAALQSMRDKRLDLDGGYPAVVDGETIPGYVLIADERKHDGPELVVYQWSKLIDWYRDALEFLKDDPEFAEDEACSWEERNGAVPGIASAMRETTPAGIDETDG